MPRTVRLRRVEDSIVIPIPPDLAAALDFKADAEVTLTIDGDKLSITVKPPPHYTLDQLLAQCDPNAPWPEGDGEWLNAPPVGRELL